MAPPKTREALYRELAPVYDLIYAQKPYRAEATEIHQIVERALGRPARSLLDVGCGTGRHLEEFDRWYPDRAGIDASREMLKVARKRLGKGVPLRVADMRTFDLHRRFDVIVCLFSAIGYLTTASDRDRAVATLAAHLSPGGVLVVEGWILPDRWKGSSSHLQIYDGPRTKIARLSSSTRRGNLTHLNLHYLVATSGGPVRHYEEVHENALVSAAETLRSFRKAGLRSRVRRSGRWKDRGLFIGQARR